MGVDLMSIQLGFSGVGIFDSTGTDLMSPNVLNDRFSNASRTFLEIVQTNNYVSPSSIVGYARIVG